MPADLDPFGEDAVEAVADAILDAWGGHGAKRTREAAARNGRESIAACVLDDAQVAARAALAAAKPFVERWADEATYGAHEGPDPARPLVHCERFNAGVLAARQALGLGPLPAPPAEEQR